MAGKYTGGGGGRIDVVRGKWWMNVHCRYRKIQRVIGRWLLVGLNSIRQIQATL